MVRCRSTPLQLPGGRGVALLSLQAQLTPHMDITDRIQVSAVGGELPERCETCCGEVGPNPGSVASNFRQTTRKHCLDRWRQLRLAGLRAAAPDTQKDPLSEKRIAPEVLAKLATNDVALRCREAAARQSRMVKHDTKLAQPLWDGSSKSGDRATVCVTGRQAQNWLAASSRRLQVREPRQGDALQDRDITADFISGQSAEISASSSAVSTSLTCDRACRLSTIFRRLQAGHDCPESVSGDILSTRRPFDARHLLAWLLYQLR
jgi:hypothetical protein